MNLVNLLSSLVKKETNPSHPDCINSGFYFVNFTKFLILFPYPQKDKNTLLLNQSLLFTSQQSQLGSKASYLGKCGEDGGMRKFVGLVVKLGSLSVAATVSAAAHDLHF